MSEYTNARLMITVRSLEKIKERLGLRELNCSGSYLSCDKRVDSFGSAISTHLKDISDKTKALSYDNDSYKTVLQQAVKIASLSQSLSEKGFEILGAITERNLSIEQKQTGKKIRELLISNDIEGLSNISNEIPSTLNNISQAVKRAHKIIALAERDVIGEGIVSVLSSEGYDVTLKAKDTGLLLRGKQKDLSIAVSLSDCGTVEIDMAGFEGKICSTQMARLEQGLRKEGIEIEVIETVHHGKKDGGVLIKKLRREEPDADNPLREYDDRKSTHTKRMLNLHHLKQRIRR